MAQSPLNARDWLALLYTRLTTRRALVERYEAYYAGDHDLVFATAEYREAFTQLLEGFATNWCGLVVDVPVERLGVQGFRFGETTGADRDAWAIWQANRMDAESQKCHTDAGKLGVSYVLVSPPNTNDATGMPRLTVEHPLQVIVHHDPADYRNRLAALKLYRDHDGQSVAIVYLPDTITVFKSPVGPDRLARMSALGIALPPMIQPWDTTPVEYPNPLGVVPVVPLENAPGTLTGGISDLRPAIALNDAANKFFEDAIVASDFAGFPQRVLTGVEVPDDPVTGQPMTAQVEAGLSRLMFFEDPNAKVFTLQAADLKNYEVMIDKAVQHLAAQTRTPPHYLLAQMVNISSDALKAAESGLIAKVKRKQVDFAEGWEEALRLAFGWRAWWGSTNGVSKAQQNRDQQRSLAMNAETIWRDPESRAPGVIADSLIKKAQVGVPWEILMEEAGYSPTQIDRMRPMRDAEIAALRAANAAAALAGEAVAVRDAESPDVPA